MDKSFDTIIIGSGCAGFNAAHTLASLGRKSVAIITEGINMGTSRNTGSDKQTYYKLSLCSCQPDSVQLMASDLMSDGVNGDTALVEAACSTRSFMKLVELGVPFPTNTFGEFVGYKTDHDKRQRATSAGPLTSYYMTIALEKAVCNLNIPIIDKMQAVKILVKDNCVYGVLCFDKSTKDFVTFSCNNIILATGGSAGIYHKSVYPTSQTGSLALAIEAGAKLSNLNQWQYGLASTKFRWNVSGSYQQCIPRYVSINENGEENEFLLDYFKSPETAYTNVFLKGYEWPFDTRKKSGSSIIDILVYHEIAELNNRVFLDFRTNPKDFNSAYPLLSDECKSYLESCNAAANTPILRLNEINPEAISLYKSHNIDLNTEMLEINLSAQHQNGGVSVDINWETSVKNLFAVGEVAGTFGEYRPGGSALNSTQVGSMRAAQKIAYSKKESIPSDINEEITVLTKRLPISILDFQNQMDKCAFIIRDIEKMKELRLKIKSSINNFGLLKSASALKERDILISMNSILSAMIFSAENQGSNGSALIIDEYSDSVLSHKYKKRNDENMKMQVITENAVSSFLKVRDMPESDLWFETVWAEFKQKTSEIKS
ncbi:MAG: FAD-binding protein [Oscillospiraceae bacterium]